MKAYVIDAFGGYDNFKLMDLPDPQPAKNEVLVAVKASSVNPIDCKLRAGFLPPLCPRFPAVLHGDFSGIVVATGADVKYIHAGDNVYGCYGGIAGKPGALAEYIAVPEHFVCKKPHTLNHSEAAAIPLVALTAWEAVRHRADLQAGGTALVIGGAGGVGHLMVQMLRDAGAQVSATTRASDKAHLLRDFGAVHVLDGHAAKIGQQALDVTQGKGFDTVFDTVGGDCFAAAQAALAGEGQIISINAGGINDTTQAYLKGARIDLINILLPVITGSGGEDRRSTLLVIARLLEQKELRPLIDTRHFGFRDAGDAHAYLESGRAQGKVALIADF